MPDAKLSHPLLAGTGIDHASMASLWGKLIARLLHEKACPTYPICEDFQSKRISHALPVARPLEPQRYVHEGWQGDAPRHQTRGAASAQAGSASLQQSGHVRRYSESHVVMQLRWNWCLHCRAITSSTSSKADKHTKHLLPMKSLGATDAKESRLSQLTGFLGTASSKRKSKS